MAILDHLQLAVEPEVFLLRLRQGKSIPLELADEKCHLEIGSRKSKPFSEGVEGRFIVHPGWRVHCLLRALSTRRFLPRMQRIASKLV